MEERERGGRLAATHFPRTENLNYQPKAMRK
jgi:hypothetical protein